MSALSIETLFDMHDLESLFQNSATHLCLSSARRSKSESDGFSLILDNFDRAACLFLRASVLAEARFRLAGRFRLVRYDSGGWLLENRIEGQPAYWLPTQATLRRLDNQGHILEERGAEWAAFDLNTIGLEIVVVSFPADWVLDAVIWRLDDPVLVTELKTLAGLETQGYFLLGSHTRYDRPADLYRHLVFGWVYEDRYAWPHKRRICSENDAHALHLIFTGLARVTGKHIYSLLKTQLLLSVLDRQSEDGAFRHGEWTNGMESHSRLHCSAMHLMMDVLAEQNDPVVKAALARAAHFISDKRDETVLGSWFLHDELELSEAGMKRSPFRWLPSRALGKAPQNMLVLNTHLDAMIALDRYRAVTGDAQYALQVESGLRAVRSVLALRPANWLYRLVFSSINLTLLPTEQARCLPIWQRAWKRIGWQVFIPHLYQLKDHFPRLVMPGGYIDRHLGLANWSFHYLTVNIMDLVRARRRFGGHGLDDVLHKAAYFAQTSGIRGRWKELNYGRYALGFWAEALWHLCQEFPNHTEYRTWYSEACTDLETLYMGLPPSHLGGNAEAMIKSHQTSQHENCEFSLQTGQQETT